MMAMVVSGFKVERMTARLALLASLALGRYRSSLVSRVGGGCGNTARFPTPRACKIIAILAVHSGFGRYLNPSSMNNNCLLGALVGCFVPLFYMLLGSRFES